MPAEVLRDDDVDAVTPLNRFYYVATRWRKAVDELKAGDIGKRRMMAESQLYAKQDNLGTYDRRRAYAQLRNLAREAIRVIHGANA